MSNKRYTALLKRLVKHTKAGDVEWKDSRVSKEDKDKPALYRLQFSPSLLLEMRITKAKPEFKVMYNYETVDIHSCPGATDLWNAIKEVQTEEALDTALNEIDSALDAIELPKKRLKA